MPEPDKKKAGCMNAVPDPDKPGYWVHCGWMGEIAGDLATEPCPRCGTSGRLAPVVEVPGV